MVVRGLKESCQGILDVAGVKINGEKPWDIRVHDDRFYGRVLSEGALGLGESYMDEWWDCDRLDEFFDRVLRVGMDREVSKGNMIIPLLKSKLLNLQNKKRALEVGIRHYDIGNDLYRGMLDERMVYTCGYWKDSDNLNDAQESKLELVCKKIGLEPGMRVLDIGCGWGSFAKYAAEKHGADVVGVTISKEQLRLGKESCDGLSVDLRFQDYRDVDEKFDRVVSLGMFEHVGVKNYRTYMKKVGECLNDDGLFLLHTIGGNRSVDRVEPWINKYIFPGGMLPSIKQISEASEDIFVLEDWHNFGVDYDKTLMAWHENFEASWDSIEGDYDERFKRMWDYYLLSFAGSFRARKNQLWQIVFSKDGVKGGYESLR
jgi:cyclopropane-fatty-acyl-phospholipid synthase